MGLFALPKFDILPVLVVMLVLPSTALGGSHYVGNQCAWNPSGPLGLLEQCRVPYNSKRTSASSSDWGPWSQKPVCVSSKTTKGPEYCAFVKEDFRGEAGLLVITSPEIAAAGHSMVEDFDPRWLGYERQAVRFDAPPFEVREMPGKGRGAVANATIRAGDVVLREHPVLLQLAEASEPVDRMQALWVLEEGFVRLPLRDQQSVFALSRSTGGHVLEDIIRTNTFGATFNDVAHFGLFPRVARINHACKPNAITRFSPRTLELEVVAYKDIEPGEELSISYSMLNMLYEDRKQALQEWGFNCTCALCSSAASVAVSDAYRARLQAILAEVTDPALGEPSLVAELADEMDDVLGREGLAAQAGEFYGTVARAYAQMGEAGAGARYARRAVEELVRFAGHDDERTARARGLLGELGKVGGGAGGA